MKNNIGILFRVLILFVILFTPVPAQEENVEQTHAENPSKEAVQAMNTFRHPEDLQVEAYASEPLLKNPTSLSIDEQGRIFIAETYRVHKGTPDNRRHNYWLIDDLAAQTLKDRLEKYKKWAKRGKQPMSHYTKESEQIRVLFDENEDAQAETSQIFADGFNGPLAGLAADVMAYRGSIYVTCIPSLWLLKDRNQDGRADVRKELHRGFGVRDSFFGHDLHGLVMGPDGRIYFSIGDRGFHIKTKDGRTITPYMDAGRGAVFRCEPDGSNLEVVHIGLRNPQDLAFDRYGNLFTVDNTSDANDLARLVYVVEGGDSGWFSPYQYMYDGFYNNRGPWQAEGLWKTYFKRQPDWIVPPLDHITSGPSGFVQYPGTGFSDGYKGKFFICDFRGNPGKSGIKTFNVKPDGATFQMKNENDFFMGGLATDVTFGYDGKLYFTDWVKGWSGSGKGRVYSMYNSDKVNTDRVKEVQKLFREGFGDRSSNELASLLRHPDKRVRQRAELILARRPEKAQPIFRKLARSTNADLFPRLHAIWGLGIIARRNDPSVLRDLVPLLSSENAEIRAQTAKVMGEAPFRGANEKLTSLLSDPSDRVRYFAAQAISDLQVDGTLKKIIRLIEENDDEDPYLRHAGMEALKTVASTKELLEYEDHPSDAVRRAVVIALRRKRAPSVKRFLDDPSPSIVTSAARAIYDLPLSSALPALADLIKPYMENGPDRESLPPATKKHDPLLRRVINANYRLGEPKHARTIIRFLINDENATRFRMEAVKTLKYWAEPKPRERVLGLVRRLDPRDPEPLRNELEKQLPRILSSTSGKLQSEVARLASRYNLQKGKKLFMETVRDSERTPDVRIQALRYLYKQEGSTLTNLLTETLKSDAPRLRAESRRILADQHPVQILSELRRVLKDGTTIERQKAFSLLGTIEKPGAEEILVDWMDRLLEGQVDRALQLDLLQAARKKESKKLKKRIKKYENSLSEEDPLAEYRVTMEGGDPEAGRTIFTDHAILQCVRCHTVDGKGGKAGPELTHVASRTEPEYLLESIIKPNAEIAEGFELVSIETKDGKKIAGTIQSSTDKTITIARPAGATVQVKRDNIKNRSSQESSSMPGVSYQLSKKQIRDLMAYLKSLK